MRPWHCVSPLSGVFFAFLTVHPPPGTERPSQLWAEVPTVTNPLLKFMEELVTNKNSRVTFENVSPNGILLFKETSRILVTYGTRALAQPLPHVR